MIRIEPKGGIPLKWDIIGDIHGCYEELTSLLDLLGYRLTAGHYRHPENRKLAFVGDLTDRGPRSLDVIRLVSDLVKSGSASYTPGNHCDKLYRYFLGRNVQIAHGLETTVAELEGLPVKEYAHIRKMFMDLVEKAPLYLVLDEKRLIVVHAGIKADDIGKTSKRVKTFVLYGDITGETNPDGTPVRRDWAKHYDGKPLIVYGHTPVSEPRFLNNTVNIDTGCVFGGQLTALRYPEQEIIQTPSLQPFIAEKFRAYDS